MSEWRGPYPFVDDAERELFSMSWSQWRDRAKAAEAEVERLTNALHESEMAREELRNALARLTTALAERDRRIEKMGEVLPPHWGDPDEGDSCMGGADG